MEQTTIAAISTPHAMGGIGIVRISGPQARIIASRVFSPKSSRKDLMSAAGYTALFGRVHEPVSYTHLDVYKRQPIYIPGRFRTASSPSST